MTIDWTKCRDYPNAEKRQRIDELLIILDYDTEHVVFEYGSLPEWIDKTLISDNCNEGGVFYKYITEIPQFAEFEKTENGVSTYLENYSWEYDLFNIGVDYIKNETTSEIIAIYWFYRADC